MTLKFFLKVIFKKNLAVSQNNLQCFESFIQDKFSIRAKQGRLTFDYLWTDKRLKTKIT